MFDQLNKELTDEGLIDEYFDLALWLEHDTSTQEGRDRADEPLPRNIRWVACWAVTGGSEGWYIHIEFDGANRDTGKSERILFALGKTFLGWDHAWKIAKRAAELLGA